MMHLAKKQKKNHTCCFSLVLDMIQSQQYKVPKMKNSAWAQNLASHCQIGDRPFELTQRCSSRLGWQEADRKHEAKALAGSEVSVLEPADSTHEAKALAGSEVCYIVPAKGQTTTSSCCCEGCSVIFDAATCGSVLCFDRDNCDYLRPAAVRKGMCPKPQ